MVALSPARHGLQASFGKLPTGSVEPASADVRLHFEARFKSLVIYPTPDPLLSCD